MIILNCDQHRNLSFVDKKYRILQGEHKFDVIKINMPESIDGVDDMQGVSIKMHFVSGNEHIDRQVVLENGYISTDIDYTLTEKNKRWLLYLAFYVNVDGEIEIGKTNAIAIQVNKLPYSDTLAKEYKEPEIVLIKGDKGDKGDPGEDGKSAYEIAVEHGYEGTEEEWLSEMKDYNELDNKPRINGHTLSGNKSADNLGLQDKLTAGENITISSGNVISAEGGVTSYNDLTDKPQINGVTLSGNKTTSDLNIETGTDDYLLLRDKPRVSSRNKNQQLYSHTIENGISFYPFNSSYDSNTGVVSLSIDNNAVIRCNTAGRTISHLHNLYSEMLNAFSYISTYTGTEINPKYQRVALIDFSPYVGNDNASWAQLAFFQDATTGEQKLAFRFSPYRSEMQRTPFVELGTKPVSAVVNQNGTITFTNSDGNTFTTTGSSVIGPQGDDYVLTAQDKSDIADIVLSELPTTQGVQYGN